MVRDLTTEVAQLRRTRSGSRGRSRTPRARNDSISESYTDDSITENSVTERNTAGSLAPAHTRVREMKRPVGELGNPDWQHPRIKPFFFFVCNSNSCKSFLVDTGAEVSVCPANSAQRKRPSPFILKAANNSRIATYGQQSLTLDIGLHRTFRWVFALADVSQPILGADFLCQFNMIVDMARRRLIDGLTYLTVTGRPSKCTSLCLAYERTSSQDRYKHILHDEFDDITRPMYNADGVNHKTTHHIEMRGPPASARPRARQT